MIRRRQFITLLGGAAAWPIAARAQQPAMPVVGFLGSASPEAYRSFVSEFRQGLKETGYVEGRNVTVEYHWAEGQYDRLPAMAAELVHRQVAVIATLGTITAVVAKAATATIPIVFSIASDPVEVGLVVSLSRPGGNLTGVTNLAVEVGSKQLELLHELVPTAPALALLVNPGNPSIAEALSNELHTAARILGVQLHILNASTGRDFNAVFADLAKLRAGGLVIGADTFFNSSNEQLAALTAHDGMPAIAQLPEFAAYGGLMSYGGHVGEAYRLAGVYTGRILSGERPVDLPVQQSTKTELTINLKTAKALGLTVPPTLLARADEVIE